MVRPQSPAAAFSGEHVEERIGAAGAVPCFQIRTPFWPGVPGPAPACEVALWVVIKSACTRDLTVRGGALHVELQVILCLHDVR